MGNVSKRTLNFREVESIQFFVQKQRITRGGRKSKKLFAYRCEYANLGGDFLVLSTERPNIVKDTHCVVSWVDLTPYCNKSISKDEDEAIKESIKEVEKIFEERNR